MGGAFPVKCYHNLNECIKCIMVEYLTHTEYRPSLHDILKFLFYFFYPPIHCKNHCQRYSSRSSNRLFSREVFILERIKSRTMLSPKSALVLENLILRLILKNITLFTKSRWNFISSLKEKDLSKVAKALFQKILDGKTKLSCEFYRSYVRRVQLEEKQNYRRVLSKIQEENMKEFLAAQDTILLSNGKKNPSRNKQQTQTKQQIKQIKNKIRGKSNTEKKRTWELVIGNSVVSSIFPKQKWSRSLFLQGVIDRIDYFWLEKIRESQKETWDVFGKNRIEYEVFLRRNFTFTENFCFIVNNDIFEVAKQIPRNPLQSASQLDYSQEWMSEEMLLCDLMPKLFEEQQQFDFSKFKDPITDKRIDVITLDPSSQRIGNYCWGKISIRGKRLKMEDQLTIMTNFSDLLPSEHKRFTTFFGVYDGHGGRAAPNFCQRHMHINIALYASSGKNMEDSMRLAHLRSENEFTRGAKLCGDTSGTTSVSVVLDPFKRSCVVSNLGDSRVVVCRGGRFEAVTKDHSPADEEERQRIMEMGGEVIYNRLNGRLAVSRAIGDLDKDKGIKTLGLSCIPDVHTIELGEDFDFMVLGCDGVWETDTTEKVCREVRRLLRVTNDAQQAAEMFAESLLFMNATDNITAIIIARERKDAETGKNYFIAPPKRRRLYMTQSSPKLSIPSGLKKNRVAASFADFSRILNDL